jgi:hypothetical protein
MRKMFMFAAVFAMMAACGGDEYEAGGEVEGTDTSAVLRVPDVDVDVSTDTVQLPDVDAPDVDMTRDTIIVDRPTIRRDSTD